MYIDRKNYNYTLLESTNPICHGGIHGFSKKLGRLVYENSYTAMKLAFQEDLATECDIRFTIDGIPVLSHNDTFFNKKGIIACNLKGEKFLISKLTYEEFLQISNYERYPLLKDIILLNQQMQKNGHTSALVLDVKYIKLISRKIDIVNFYTLVNNHNFEICVQSFNPLWMLSLRKYLKSDVLTLQLICKAKTLFDTFHPPIIFANIYEKWISCICVIARTDGISMELHSDKNWDFHTRWFHDATVANRVASISLENITNKLQLFLVNIVKNLTKKPVIGWTATDDIGLSLMDPINSNDPKLICNRVVDFSNLGIEAYIEKIKKIR